MKSALSLVAFLTAIGLVAARDWHSTDGRTLPGEFVKLTGETLTVKSANGHPVTVPLKILRAEDQSYAQAAQALNEGAVKLGPQAFEVALNYGGGSLCRFPLTRMKATDPLMFAGEQFFLVGEAAAAKKGSQLKDQLLFSAGNRTLHPLQGDAFPVRSFALTADQALAASSSPPDIYEPMIEQIEVRGLGYPISDSGLILVDSKLLVSINSLVVDLGKDLENATVVANNSDLGIAIIAAKSATTAMRLAPRKPLELGQPVKLLSLKHGEYAKSLEDAIVTQGTITNLSAPNGPLYFEHNAPRDPDAVGGLVLSDKGDVIGLMTQKNIIKRGTSKDGVITREPVPENLLTTALRTEALMPFLKTVPKVTADRSPTGTDEADLAKTLHKTVVMVRVVRETRRDMSPAAVAAAEAAAAKDPNAMRWSISKSGTRHNSTCENFNPKKLCKSTDGTPCKNCGG